MKNTHIHLKKWFCITCRQIHTKIRETQESINTDSERGDIAPPCFKKHVISENRVQNDTFNMSENSAFSTNT